MRPGYEVRILEISDVPKVYQGLPGVIAAVEKDFYIVKTETGELACPKDYVEVDLTKPVKKELTKWPLLLI